MKQALSIDQMKHLKEFGLDTSDASMHWQFLPTADSIINGTDEIEKEPCLFVSQPNMKHEYPAYILQDILDKLPVCLYDFGKQYTMDIEPTFDRFWCVSYEIDLYDIFVLKSSKNLLDAAYDMLCWCIEKEYVKVVMEEK